MAAALGSPDSRVAVVLKHMRLENEHDFAGCIAAFGHPRYEVMATDEVYDGADAVEVLLLENRHAFPDFHFDFHRVTPAEDLVVVEGTFTGRQDGPWRGLPATGRPVSVAMAIVFEFEGEDLICERVYFDLGTVLRQLGIARDPTSVSGRIVTLLTHPVTIARALWRLVPSPTDWRGARP